MRYSSCAYVLGVALATTATVAQGRLDPVLHVDADATGPLHDGSSWCQAFLTLDQALAAATAGTTVRVAQGTYTPDSTGLDDPRAATFTLVEGVAIEGGYAGCGEPDPNQRDVTAYRTELSGDLNGDDGPEFTNYEENCYHVVTALYVGDTTVLDGLTISGGHADGPWWETRHTGAGLLSVGGNPTFRRCTFTGNRASWRIDVAASLAREAATSETVDDTSNVIGRFVVPGSLGTTYVLRRGGHSEVLEATGQALSVWARDTEPPVTAGYGGAVANLLSATTFSGCVFFDNAADWGGAVFNLANSPAFINCTLHGNRGLRGTGGIYSASGSDPLLASCILWGNMDDEGEGEAAQVYGDATTARHCCIAGWSDRYAGTGNFSVDPLFVDADARDYHLQEGSPCINAGEWDTAGAGLYDLDGRPRIQQCRVDIGVYETPYFVDCNENKLSDACELVDGTTPDANTNGLPDECEFVAYVDDDAPPGGDGRSWDTAFNNPQDAAALVDIGYVRTLRVAQGIYHPTGPDGDRTISFRLLSGTEWIGGYAGFGAPDPDARDPAIYKSSLSGDLNDNDGPEFANNGENSLHVLAVQYADPTTMIDGFCIMAGNADGFGQHGEGGGGYVEGGSPTLVNCAFTGNAAAVRGGALHILDSQPTVSAGTFNDNAAGDYGGAAYGSDSVLTLADCDFAANTSGYGGGALMFLRSSVTLTRCTLTQNSSDSYGGALYALWCGLSADDCTFADNMATERSGGAIYCVGTRMDQADASLANCVLAGNSANWDGGGLYAHDATVAVTHCTFEANTAGTGGGIYSEDCVVDVSSCTFAGNDTTYNGGGIFLRDDIRASVASSAFVGNTAGSHGGAVASFSYSSSWAQDYTHLTNCAFSGNSCGANGGAVRSLGLYPPVLASCTLSANFSAGAGGGIYADEAPLLTSCILWGNGDDTTGTDELAQIHSDEGVEISYSCVQGWTGALGGTGNLGDDPAFLDPAGPDEEHGTEDDDLRLAAGSPAVNAGAYDTEGLPEHDLNGAARVQYCRLDMGAYESSHEPATYPDCNTNGVNDDCDLFDGLSPDCNLNNVPDECDVAFGSSPDCNVNGTPDECDVDDETSPDCNLNAVPDECDIQPEDPDDNGDFSTDCDTNGIPDECDAITKLVPTSLPADAHFGSEVAMDGDVAVVGARYDDGVVAETGSVYVFRFDGSRWLSEAKLTASDGASQDWFGHALSVKGDVIVVGAWRNDHAGTDSGAVYVYRFDGADWVEEAKLRPADIDSGDYFGQSVALGNGTVLIGAPRDEAGPGYPGAAYVFRHDGVQWLEEQKITATDRHDYVNFGKQVALHGPVALIGADSGPAGPNAGSVYVFRSDGTTWTQEARLSASDGMDQDYFGDALALQDDLAAIGAWGHDAGGRWAGAAYVFRFDGVNWIETAKLIASDGGSEDRFGYSVAVRDDLLLVGAYVHDDAADNDGGAYRFRHTGHQWMEYDKLTSLDAAEDQWFGTSVAISEDWILIGAGRDDQLGVDAGAAYALPLGFDCNENCVDDETDVANGTSPDCNSNLIPDECEVPTYDCNTNSVPDDCDVAEGTSQDSDGDGLPDECEPEHDCNNNNIPDDVDIAEGTSEDCNSNGVPDECELLDNDCNTNSIPDDCDLADGTSWDLNRNGIPDECEDPLTLPAISSCRTHGWSEEFCLPMGMHPSSEVQVPNIDPRWSSIDRLVIRPVEPLSSDPVVIIDCGYGPVDDVDSWVEGELIAVDISGGLLDNACCTVILEETGEAYQVISFYGDTTRDGVVNTVDYSAVRARLGQSVDHTNFQFDLDYDGEITVYELDVVRFLMGEWAPTCP